MTVIDDDGDVYKAGIFSAVVGWLTYIHVAIDSTSSNYQV